jgi:hypothetical protein
MSYVDGKKNNKKVVKKFVGIANGCIFTSQ